MKYCFPSHCNPVSCILRKILALVEVWLVGRTQDFYGIIQIRMSIYNRIDGNHLNLFYLWRSFCCAFSPLARRWRWLLIFLTCNTHRKFVKAFFAWLYSAAWSQCCEFGMFIPETIFFSYRISDPTKTKKEAAKKLVFLPFFSPEISQNCKLFYF